MSAGAGWRSKCPYNFGSDAEACDPCPHCDADNSQPVTAVNAEVGHVCDAQQAPLRRVIGTAAENIGIGQAVELAPAVGLIYIYRGTQSTSDPTPPKPPLCWICGKPLPHDCVGDSGLPTNTKHGSVTVTANGLDIIIGSAHRSNGLLVERADVSDLLAAVAEAYGLKHSPAQSGQPTLTDLPKINLELPDGDSREAKVRWSEWSADRKSLGVCISVTHGPPNNAEVSAIIQSWLDKQGHERCWYYPELFNQLAAALGLKATVAPGLPSRQEFARGCDRYQAEQYSNAQTAITHGPPQSQQSAAANSFAPSAPTATARKWPIGTPSDDHYNLAWGFRLQQARAHRGHTLDALGARLNPPRTRKDISAMEHGRRGLSVELCAELAQALDCDRCWLAGWKEGA